MNDLQEKFAEKIASLLRKAESTTPEEAELLIEKAQTLMMKYAIEQTMIDAMAGKEREDIVEKTIKYKSSYHHGLFAIGYGIAQAQSCRVLMTRYKNQTDMHVIGFESDVERAIMLDSSLQIQAQAALRAAIRSNDVLIASWMTAMQKFAERRQFLLSYAAGVITRLERANQIARDEVIDEAIKAGQPDVAPGMELMLRSRKDRVNDWVDQHYGKLTKSRAKLRGGSGQTRRAGYSAGLNADTGSAGRIKTRRELRA